VITIAGVLAPRINWNALWIEWDKALAEEGIAVFHATECEGAQKVFRGWDRSRTEALQRRLIDIIVEPAHDVMLYSTILDIGAYRVLQPRVRGYLAIPFRAKR